MKLLPKQFQKEIYTYYSEKNIDTLRAEMQALFTKTRGFNFSTNLTGKFFSENEFKAEPKWSLISTSNIFSMNADINGKLETEGNKTRISFILDSDSTFTGFFVLCSILTLLFLGQLILAFDKQDLIAIPVLIAIALLNMVIARSVKNSLKKRFVSYFNLSQTLSEINNESVKIYIPLLNEGVDTWRPTTAEKVDVNLFKIHPTTDYDPSDEEWEFLPGSIVSGKDRKMSSGEVVFVAIPRV